MRRWTLRLGVVEMLPVPTTASADILTYTVAGQWRFYDPQTDALDFWAALGTLGMTNGTPSLWNVTVDTATG